MRNKRLDILRCIAVITVILHHSGESTFFTRVGWTGVDLFFVLSGFLISGLLFSEYKRRHSISFKRFFIRRGLKIYPAFYAFLLLTGITGALVFHSHPTSGQYFHEIFFVMNYEHGVWDHTWSLAVEEHFYIFLPVFLFVLARLSSNRENPFRSIPQAATAIAALCLIFRAFSVFVGKPNFKMAYIGSHERMDALFIGVLIGYFYHFRPAVLEELMRPTGNRIAIAAGSLCLLSPAYLYSRENVFLATFGYSLIYLGFAGVLLLGLYVRGILSGKLAWIMELVGSVAAYVGMYSYSIYLWHGPTAAWLPGFFRRTLGFPVGHYGRFVVYFVGSLVIGIVMSKLVEYPILRLRDRILPASNIIPVAAQVGIGPALTTGSDAPLSDDVRGQQVLLDTQRVARVDPG
jgi:peptidoglycan/LPS O-acetylase OafA/YrhL